MANHVIIFNLNNFLICFFMRLITQSMKILTNSPIYRAQFSRTILLNWDQSKLHFCKSFTSSKKPINFFILLLHRLSLNLQSNIYILTFKLRWFLNIFWPLLTRLFIFSLQSGQYQRPLGPTVTPTHLKWNHSRGH